MSSRTKHYRSIIITGTMLVVMFTLSLLAARVLAENHIVSGAIGQFGYLGVVISGVIAGLNSLVPIPAATLTPIFTSAGLSLPLIILSLAIGTLIADFAGYGLGHLSRQAVERQHPKAFRAFTTLYQKHQRWVPPVAFACAAIMPFPNEVLLIPLALSGARFTPLVLPLFLGSLINQTILVYGVDNLTRIF